MNLYWFIMDFDWFFDARTPRGSGFPHSPPHTLNSNTSPARGRPTSPRQADLPATGQFWARPRNPEVYVHSIACISAMSGMQRRAVRQCACHVNAKNIFNEWRSACFHYYHDTLRYVEIIVCMYPSVFIACLFGNGGFLLNF